MTESKRRAAVCLAVVALAAPAVRGGDSEELDRLSAANTAAVESIRTLHCKVRVDDPVNRFGVTGGEYWRAGRKERLHFIHKGHENRAVIADGSVRYMVKQDVTNDSNMKGLPEVRESLDGDRWYWHGAVERHDGGSPFQFAPWCDALCSLSDGGKRGNVTFAEFVTNHRREVVAVRRATVGGLPTETVEFRFPDAVCTVHLDPAANYMVRRVERTSNASSGYSSSAEVTSFREASPGVFFPVRVVNKRRDGGRTQPDETFTFTDIEVNKPLNESTFALKFRPGITIIDRVRGTKYKVREDGTPVSAERPISVASSPDISPADREPATETREEPRRAGWWLLPVSALMLGLGGCLWAVRRRRAGSA